MFSRADGRTDGGDEPRSQTNLNGSMQLPAGFKRRQAVAARPRLLGQSRKGRVLGHGEGTAMQVLHCQEMRRDAALLAQIRQVLIEKLIHFNYCFLSRSPCFTYSCNLWQGIHQILVRVLPQKC
ncbi:Ammonium transporter [Psidium guajava]|nr:Ammonium transporter [Psidium guajava]